MPEAILDLNNTCDILNDLIQTHALISEQRAKVDIFSRNRGGVGSRGYGKNSLGYEIAWWVHPERYQKERFGGGIKKADFGDRQKLN